MNPSLALAVERLANILRAENAMLASLHFGRIGSLVEEKRLAIEAMSQLTAAATPSFGLDQALRDQVGELQRLAEENKILLERGIMVQNRIMAVVARAARKTQTPSGYGSNGVRPSPASTSAYALIAKA